MLLSRLETRLLSQPKVKSSRITVGLALSASAAFAVSPIAQALTPTIIAGASPSVIQARVNEKIAVKEIRLVKLDPKDTKDLLSLPITQFFMGRTVSVAELECLRLGINHYYQKNTTKLRSLVWTTISSSGMVSGVIGQTDHPIMQGAGIAEKCDNAEMKKIALSDVITVESKPSPVVSASTTTTTQSTLTPVVSNLMEIVFQGNKTLSKEDLLPSVIGFVGKPLNETMKKDVAELVRQTYLDEGFLVTQVVPTVKGNNLVLDIFEGNIDKLVIKNKTGYTDDDIRKYAGTAMCDDPDKCQDHPLYSEKLERAIGIISDLPATANAKVLMAPGSKIGSTNVEITADKGDDYSGYISANNYGNKATGNPRMTFGLIGNNWAGIGDQMVLEATITSEKKNTVGQLAYSIPVGYDGWRIGANYARSEYSLADIFKDLKAHGVSDSLSLWASYPIIRSSPHNLSFRVAADYNKPKNYILDVLQPKSTSEGLSLSLAGRLTDQIALGRSYSTYGAVYSQSTTKKDDDNFTGATGTFKRIQYNASRDQEIMRLGDTGRLSFYASVRGQEANKRLDPSVRFSLGGPSGVRAYPSGEAYGDRGVVGSLELRYNVFLQPYLPGFVTVSLFHDHGWKRNVDIDSGTKDYLQKTLYGNGVSVNFSVLDRWNIRADWAKRNKNSAVATTENNPKDSRLWITGSVSF